MCTDCRKVTCGLPHSSKLNQNKAAPQFQKLEKNFKLVITFCVEYILLTLYSYLLWNLCLTKYGLLSHLACFRIGLWQITSYTFLTLKFDLKEFKLMLDYCYTVCLGYVILKSVQELTINLPPKYLSASNEPSSSSSYWYYTLLALKFEIEKAWLFIALCCLKVLEFENDTFLALQFEFVQYMLAWCFVLFALTGCHESCYKDGCAWSSLEGNSSGNSGLWETEGAHLCPLSVFVCLTEGQLLQGSQ